MASIVRRKDGSYLVRWRVGGRGSKQLSKQFKIEEEALAFKVTVEPSPYDKMERDLKRRGEYKDPLGKLDRFGRPFDAPAPEAVDESMSVAGYAKRMIEELSNSRTRALYRRQIRHHLEGTPLGKQDVRNVESKDISAWWKNLKDANTGEPAGPGVQRGAQQILARVFNRAVLVGDIDVSPLKRTPEVKRPPRQDRDVERLTVGQLEKLAEAAGESRRGRVGPAAEMVRERDRLLVLTMGWSGLREGEVGGLRLSDVLRAGKRCRLRVERQVVRETGEGANVVPVKTKAGKRTVSIPCWLADEIEAFAERHPGTHIFHKPDGRLMAANDINHTVSKAGERIGLDVHGHLLRHTFASIAVEAGANPEALRKMLGHSKIETTLGTYSHMFEWGGDQIADTLERIRDEHRNGGK